MTPGLFYQVDVDGSSLVVSFAPTAFSNAFYFLVHSFHLNYSVIVGAIDSLFVRGVEFMCRLSEA